MKTVHGSFVVTRCGNVMLTQAYGPWNRECVDSLVLDYRQKSIDMHGSKWGDIVVLEGESLLIPDAESLLTERLSAVHHLGLSHLALVLESSLVKSTTRNQLEVVYRQTGVDFSFFETYEEARTWLIHQGYTLDEVEERTHFAKAKQHCQ
ncbi:hypothetical protein Q4561_08020 [Alteromonas sp. 1_MG-2023]|uniref:hypothetical protein n=1 Tax=Alteromonas sp. 1_MG-2023 TaxID=3062669 RepID=UPI0026E1B084|nr:hypothetical protein [Alteromonas sp. 1_MG-2023]MDO6567004.1 hypothetical protein [Alteromonas sp. 1_MG-2023]